MASKIILKKSSVAAKAPVAGDLDFGELAINYTDSKLYFKKADGSIDSFVGSSSAAVGVTSVNGLTGAITANQILDAVKSVDGAGSGLDADTLDGNSSAAFYLASNPSGYTSNTGTVTSVGATSPVVSSGGNAPSISIPAATASADGYMTAAYASKLDGVATGATNVTNTNQLTNGAGYITSSGSISGNAATATTASTANALNTANNYTGNSFTASSTDGYFYANRSAVGYQAGVQFQTAGITNWYNFLDNNTNTLTWYQTATGTQVMTLTQAGALNVVGGITQAGNQVLHAGNYSSYALPLAGGTVTGVVRINNQLQVGQNTNGTAWIDAYGGFAYYGADSNSTGIRVNSAGNVRIGGGNTSPNGTGFSHTIAGVSSSRVVNFDGNGSLPSVWWTNGATALFAIDGTTAGALFWANSGGTWQQQMSVTYGTVNVNTALQQGGNQVLHAGNYTSYSPSLTGSGASGTWGINVTGTAASISGFNNPATAATANTIVYRDSGGDIYGRYMFAEHFNQSSSNSENPSIAGFWTNSAADNYNRKSSPAHVISQLGLLTTSNYSTTLQNNYMRAIGYASTSNDWNALGNAFPNTVEQIDPTNFSSTSNGPVAASYDYGLLLNLSAQSSAQAQIYISHIGNDLIFRGGWNGTGWYPWNKALTNQNYTSYALPLTGGTLSGDLSIASGNFMVGTATPFGIVTISKTVNNGTAVATNISNFGNSVSVIHNQDDAGTGNKTGLFFAHAGSPGLLSGIASTKLSGTWQTTLDFYVNNITGGDTGQIQLAGRFDSAGNFNVINAITQNGNQVLHAGNYTSYAPSLTGSGASGSWGISITGDSATVGGVGQSSFMRRAADSWNTSADGQERFYFSTGGRTYYRSVAGHEWRNSSDSNIGAFDNSGNFNAVGAITQAGNQVLHAGNYTTYPVTEWYHSGRDFPSGTLITTNINYAVSNGDPFVLEIRGNSYGNIVPLDLVYQGYIYADTIINHGGISNGFNITGLVAINNGGNLCFWFPSQGYWNGYNVKVYRAYGPLATNCVTSIDNAAKPTTTKEVALSANIRQSLHSGNYGSYALPLTGGTLSGDLSIASGQVSAPIFYDYNDTNYYVDPASGSRLSRFLTLNGGGTGVYGNELVVGNTSVSYSLQDVNQRPIIQAHGAYPVLSLNHTVTSNSSHGPTVQFTANGTGHQFAIGMNGTGTQLDIGVSSFSNWNPHNGIANLNGTTGWRMDTSGNVFNYVSSRAPIFYDNEDTVYYVDPNSTTSAIFAGSVGINNTSPINSAWGNSTNTKQLSINGSDYAVINLRGALNGARTFSMGVGDNLFYMAYDNNAERHNITINSSGNVTAAVDFRAPIFYDSNDTGYYTNPHGTSSLNVVNANSGTFYGSTYFQSNLGSTSGSLSSPPLQAYSTGNNSAFMSFHRGGYYAVNMGLDSDNVLRIGGWSASANRWQLDMGGHNTVAGSSRAPIFYDSTDTAFYIQPTALSRISSLRLTEGPFYYSTGGTGQFIHDSDATPVAFSMTKAGNSTADSANFGVLNLRRTNHSNSATTAGASLFFELKSDSGGTVEYAGITGRKTVAGASGGQLDFHNSFRNVIGYTNADELTHTSSVRAPIFYDSGNTGYYIDPASTSKVVSIDLRGKIDLPNGAGNGGAGFSNYHYSMGVDIANNSWSHPHYSDLIIGYHTGIRLGAGYSGIRFYNNSPTTDANNDGNGDSGEALLMTIGGYVGTANQTDVLVNNNLFANSSVRSPIFYDSNNTTYYFDGAGTSLWNGSGQDSNHTFNNYGAGIVGTYSASRYQAVFGMGTGYLLPTDGSTTGSLYGIAWSHPNAGGAAANLSTHGALILENGAFLAALSGSIRSRDDMRTLIFYDSANTAYYLDPAATGTSLNVAGAIVAAGNITAYSDERLKSDWKTLPNDFVENLAEVLSGTFTRTDNAQRQAGVGAQSLQKILPETVVGNGILSVAYGNAAMVSAVELAKRVVQQEKRIALLEKRLSMLLGD